MNPSYLNTVQGMTQLYEIQSSTEITDGDPLVGQNKWRYVVKPATLQTMSPTTAPVKGLSSDETFLTGWNVYESQNTDAIAMGIDTGTLQVISIYSRYQMVKLCRDGITRAAIS